MGNCLYTQLKATVNNSELFKLNELRFKVEGNTSNTFQLEVGYGGTTPYTVESDGVTWNASTHIITGESGTISLFPKEIITVIKIANLTNGVYIVNKPEDVFKYCDIYTFKGKFAGGWNLSQIKDISTPNLDVFSAERDTTVIGDIDAFKDRTSIKNIGINYCTGIYGNLSSFAKLINLNYLYLRSTNIDGELTDFAAAQVANDRTSGALYVTCNGKIKLNGDIVADNTIKTITFDSSLPNGYSIS